MSAHMVADTRLTKAAVARKKRRRARCRDFAVLTRADYALLRCSNCGGFLELHWFPERVI